MPCISGTCRMDQVLQINVDVTPSPLIQVDAWSMIMHRC